MLLENKNIVITGGSGGIGNAVVEEFLKEGARVYIFGRNENTLAETIKKFSSSYPDRCFGEATDVSDFKGVEASVKKVLNKLGQIDILINAAGIHGTIGPLWETNPKEWETAIKVNLLGTVYMMRALLPHMISEGRGKIINFSGGGATSSRPFFSSYAASKIGVVRLTEIVAEELREKDHKIDVNAIAPGAINTKILDEIIAAGPEKAGEKEYNEIKKIKESGGADPKKVAALTVFLASHLSDGLSGRLISAVWDNWQEIPKHLKEIMESDIYTLRRIKPEDRGYTKW